MLIESSSPESRSVVTHESVDEPVTSSVVTDSHETSAADELQPCTTVHQSMMDCNEREDPPQKSVAAPVVHKHRLSTASSSPSSCGKVSHRRANSNRNSTRVTRGQRKTTSDADRTLSTCRVIAPVAAAVATDNHHSNVTTASACVDAKARLRDMILSGSRRSLQKPGK